MGFFKNIFGKGKDQSLEYKKQRLVKLRVLEAELKSKRDFSSLIKVHDEVIELVNAPIILLERIPQKAYCLARLGKKKAAVSTIQELTKFNYLFDEDRLLRAVTLISFFSESEPSKFIPMQVNTIRAWLNDSSTSEEVKQIVFDYDAVLKEFPVEYTTRQEDSLSRLFSLVEKYENLQAERKAYDDEYLDFDEDDEDDDFLDSDDDDDEDDNGFKNQNLPKEFLELMHRLDNALYGNFHYELTPQGNVLILYSEYIEDASTAIGIINILLKNDNDWNVFSKMMFDLVILKGDEAVFNLPIEKVHGLFIRRTIE